MAARKTTKAAQEAQEKSAGDRVLWSAVLFAMGILTAAFTFIKGESAWSSIHNIILGMFGWTALIVPFVLIYVSVMIAMDKSRQTVQGKVIQCFIIIFLLTAMMQVLTGTEELGANLLRKSSQRFMQTADSFAAAEYSAYCLAYRSSRCLQKPARR